MNSSRSTWIPQWLSSVRAVMILLISLATIFPLGIILYQGLQHRTQAFIDSRALSERLTAEVAFDQQLLLSSAKQLMSTFSYIPAIRRRDTVATNALLVDLLRENPQITNFLDCRRKGECVGIGAADEGPHQCGRPAIFQERHGDGTFLVRRIQYRKDSEQTYHPLRLPTEGWVRAGHRRSGRFALHRPVRASLPVEGVGDGRFPRPLRPQRYGHLRATILCLDRTTGSGGSLPQDDQRLRTRAPSKQRG